MVEVTRLNGTRFALNSDLIARVYESPDTTIVMLDGGRHIVAESMREVIALVEQSRARVLVLASAGLANGGVETSADGDSAHTVVTIASRGNA